jgi:hypothetical protein
VSERGVGILYKLIVAAQPLAVSHDYNARGAHQRAWAVDAEPGCVGQGMDLFYERLDADWPLNKSVPFLLLSTIFLLLKY